MTISPTTLHVELCPSLTATERSVLHRVDHVMNPEMQHKEFCNTPCLLLGRQRKTSETNTELLLRHLGINTLYGQQMLPL